MDDKEEEIAKKVIKFSFRIRAFLRPILLCSGPHSGACKESRPQPTSQIDDVTWNTSADREFPPV